MKVLFFVILLGFSLTTVAQTPEFVTIQSADFSTKNLNILKTQLEKLKGVRMVGFSEEQSMVELAVDRQVQAADYEIISCIQDAGWKDILVKTPATPEQLQASLGDFQYLNNYLSDKQ